MNTKNGPNFLSTQRWKPSTNTKLEINLTALCRLKMNRESASTETLKTPERITRINSNVLSTRKKHLLNIILARDVIRYTKVLETAWSLSIRKKHFTKLIETFFIKILEKFNFGQNFIYAMKQFMNDTQSIIINRVWKANLLKLREMSVKNTQYPSCCTVWQWKRRTQEFQSNCFIDGIPLATN